MSVSTNQAVIHLYSEATPSHFKFENPSISTTAITLESTEVTMETIDNLFKEQVINNQHILDEQTRGISEKQASRAARKQEKKLKKISAANKTCSFCVTIPENKVLSGQGLLELRFSQDSIKDKTSDGIPLENLTKNMSETGWKKQTVLVAVEMPDGKLVSLNNRRLYAAKKVAENKDNFEVPIVVYKHSDKAPTKLLRGIQSEYNKLSQNRQNQGINQCINKASYGHCVVLRINTRSGDIANSIFGYPELPEVRTN